VDGDLRITKRGAVVSRVDVAGCINVLAVNVTIKNSKAHCIALPSGSKARYCHYGEPLAVRRFTECTVVPRLTNNPDSATNNPRLTVRDSVINCHGRVGTYGIGDRNIKVIRVEIRRCENGFDADSYMTVRDSYIHDLYNLPDGDPRDPHTDGLQSAIVTRLRIVHNVIYDFNTGCNFPNDGSCNGTAALMMGGQHGWATSRKSLVKRNLLAGGAYSLYCPYDGPRKFRILENYFSTVYSPHVGEFGPTDGCRKPGIHSSGNKRLIYKTGRVKSFRPV
jgi:hypothetical protein